MRCGHAGPLKQYTPGSFGMELLLWCLILPGLLYSLWRHLTRYSGCERCWSRETIPVDSPVGQSIHVESSPGVNGRPSQARHRPISTPHQG